MECRPFGRQEAWQQSEKYLDELLIQGVVFQFFSQSRCARFWMPAGLGNATLQEHDQRENQYAWETHAEGWSNHSGCVPAKSLKHGELHNNVRMTWGKAFLRWASTPAAAMQLTMDLNHRYALDGRDPCSYGGVLWCFGLFDRPFKPEEKIFGSVRDRSCESHQSRLNLSKYMEVVDRPIAAKVPRIAVVGAGVGGLMASRLQDHGLGSRSLPSHAVRAGVYPRVKRMVWLWTMEHSISPKDSCFTRYVGVDSAGAGSTLWAGS